MALEGRFRNKKTAWAAADEAEKWAREEKGNEEALGKVQRKGQVSLITRR